MYMRKHRCFNFNIYVCSGSAVSYVDLPYIVKGMDVSFSGILTFAETYFNSKKDAAATVRLRKRSRK